MTYANDMHMTLKCDAMQMTLSCKRNSQMQMQQLDVDDILMMIQQSDAKQTHNNAIIFKHTNKHSKLKTITQHAYI